MQLEFSPNRAFSNIGERNQPQPDNYFEQYYYCYMKYALSWASDLLDLVAQHASEYLRYLSPLAKKNALPLPIRN